MTKKKGLYIVGRVDGKKLPSGFRRKRFHKQHDAEVYVILLTAQEAAKRKMPPGGYYVDGPNAPPRVSRTERAFTTKPNAKGQLVIPKAIRQALGIVEGDTLAIEYDSKNKKLLIRKDERSAAGAGQYIDVRSASRPEIVHHVYTGDSVNGVHCTCEAFHHGTRERDVLFVCKHIDEVVFGGGT